MNDELNAKLFSHELLIINLLLLTAHAMKHPRSHLESSREALTNRIPTLRAVQELGPQFGDMVLDNVNALLDATIRSLPTEESSRE